MKPHRPGALVRVLESALLPTAKYYSVNQDTVKDDGYIYYIQGLGDGSGLVEFDEYGMSYECRSLATGNDSIVWYHFEIEGVEDSDA